MAKRHEEWWAKYLRQPSEQRSIAPVLFLTLLAMVLTPALSNHAWGRSVVVGIVGASAVLALTRTGAHGALRRGAEAIVVVTTVVAAVVPNIQGHAEDHPLQIAASGMFTLLLLITPIVVMLRMMLRPKITVDTLAGALTAYLQIGIFFGALFRFDSLLETAPFFAQNIVPKANDFQYFSFITMTTVGYGDLTPATPVGQTLATMEAIMGQVFLVTVVALTVSNLGRAIPHRQGLDLDGDGKVDVELVSELDEEAQGGGSGQAGQADDR
jgi:hypothetical protein